jgi:hypothetical protein
MSTTAQETCRSVRDVAAALHGVADALASADLQALLDAEPVLEDLTRALARATATPMDRAALGPELRAARLALGRAVRLGQGLALFRTASEIAQGRAVAYDRDGRTSQATQAGQLQARG